MKSTNSNELVKWAEDIVGQDESPVLGGIQFSDEMKDRFDSLDALNKDVEDQDEALNCLIEEWKESRSSMSLVQIMAIGYKYIIGAMMRRETWRHLTPDEAMTAAFRALPRSISIFTPGKSKFLSFWARGAEMAWTAQKQKGGNPCSPHW